MEYNRSQILGLDLDKHIVLDAGAGTGKTTVMAERYVQHLLSSDQRATLVLPDATSDEGSLSKDLMVPVSQRENLGTWTGLLPSEVVAITFTRKAAAELKARIRKKLNNLKSDVESLSHEDHVFDFRLKGDSSIAKMLISQLDDAPVSTIDAFFSRLVSMHMDMLTDKPTNEQISDERSQILREHAIFSAWRARNLHDARKMGILDGDNFIRSRNRLTIALNGQYNAEKVLIGLMKNSLFVEEAKKHLKSKSEKFGKIWYENSNISKEIFIDIFTNPVTGLVDSIIDNLIPALRAFIDSYLEEYAHFIQPTYPEHGGYSRFYQLQTLVGNVPESEFAKIQWLYAVIRTGLSKSAIGKLDFTNFFKPKSFSREKEWKLGILGVTKAKKTMKPQKRAKEVSDTAEDFRQQILSIINTRDCKLLFSIGSSAFNYIPQILFTEIPPNSKYARDEITNPPQKDVHSRDKSVLSSDLQVQVLTDLFTVFKGCQQVFSDLKKSEEVHDFDDTMRYAEDLLLAKCPSLVRTIWPQEIVEALDSLPDDSWSDAHISKAMRLAIPHPDVHDQIVMRFKILQNLRRKYRAFIIDEFQDTNPAQFRLLTRLWGKRSRETSEGDSVLGYWDPTICVVGDMKQSIYRFRQAEVTVMKKATQYIKEANNLEVYEKRMAHLLKEGKARDPRFQRGTGFTPADKEGDHRVHGPKEEYNSVAFKDGSESILVDDEKRDRRSMGHIDLTSNFRTRHNLMNTFNHLFDDVFHPRHHKFPGDWHAAAQELIPASRDESVGKLEWIMPIPKKSDEPKSMDEEMDVFSSPTSTSKELEAELIALRIRAMLDKSNRKIWSNESESLVDIGADTEEIRPDDIMILLHSRGRAPGIIRALQKYRIPTQVDQYGLLLEQDVVKPLISVLELLARPDSRHAQASIALSPIMNCSESEVHQKMQSKFTANGWTSMIELCSSDRKRNLIRELEQLNQRGARYEILESILDNSDLLFTYPEPHERQHAEAFLTLVRMIGSECGDEIAVIYSRIRELMSLENSGPKASSSSLSGSVKLMTIHKSKGLESKVVIVSGLFAAGKQDASMTGGSDVLVTPQLISCRVRPWQSRETPAHGLYELTSAIEKAQKRAERRREFYVALTRVKSHLILCGVNDSQKADDNFTTMNLNASDDSMAHFLLEGLRGTAWAQKLENSDWLLENDLNLDQLDEGDEQWKSKMIDPYSLHINSGLPEDCVNSITIYHSPDCFMEQKSESLAEYVTRINENFDSVRNKNQREEKSLPSSTHKFRVTAHSLDTSSKCRRRHWLTRVRGWNPEKFEIPRISKSVKSSSKFPSPTKFGLLAHRLVEIGLANPATQLSTPKLDESWLIQNENGLQEPELAERVMRELGLGDDSSDDKIESTKKRLLEIGELIQSGPLGLLSEGGEFDGYKVEGLRTELPFFHSEKITSDDIVRYSDIGKQNPVALVDAITAYFDGRIDLVIALTDKSGSGYLQVVDLKTKGCLNGFNFESPENGTKLQRHGNQFSLHAETYSEKDLVNDYRLQLALYSVILENSEAQKSAEQRRIILPPAILVGASGKMIRLTDEDYAKAKHELKELLEFMGILSANPNVVEEPSRAEDDYVCKKCPFYSGEIKLCGPQSFNLFGSDN